MLLTPRSVNGASVTARSRRLLGVLRPGHARRALKWGNDDSPNRTVNACALPSSKVSSAVATALPIGASAALSTRPNAVEANGRKGTSTPAAETGTLNSKS